jgi:hypothetical protein
MKKMVGILLLVILLASCSQQATPNAELSAQAGTWQKMGGALDFTADKSAVNPTLLQDSSGNLVAAWAENNGGWRVYLERWTSTGWQSFGAGTPAIIPSLYYIPSFSVVFDATNSPVVAIYSSVSTTNYQSKVAVYRQDTASKTWKQLGTSFTGPSMVASDASGAVYSVLYDKLDPISGPRGKNLIRRWNGSSWQTIYTFQKTLLTPYSSPSHADAAITSLKFQSNGKPAIVWWAAIKEQRNSLSRWDGTSWVDDSVAKHEDFITLDKKDQDLSVNTRYNPATNGNKTTITQAGKGIWSSDNVFIEGITVDNANLPVVSFNDPYKGDVTAQRYNGSTLVSLGGVVDRLPSRYANGSTVFVDSKGTVYAAWSECVGTINVDPNTGFIYPDTCTNYNIYVSKYVP